MIDVRWMWRSLRKTCQQINGNIGIVLLKKAVHINSSCLVTKSPFWYWGINKNKKNGLTEEALKTWYRSLWQWDIACDEKTLLRQPSVSAKSKRTSFYSHRLCKKLLLHIILRCDIDACGNETLRAMRNLITTIFLTIKKSLHNILNK